MASDAIALFCIDPNFLALSIRDVAATGRGVYLEHPIVCAIELASCEYLLGSLSTPNAPAFIVQWSHGCFQPKSAGPSFFARYINCACQHLSRSYQISNIRRTTLTRRDPLP